MKLATIGTVTGILCLLTSLPSMALADGAGERLERRGDRIEEHLDRKGDRHVIPLFKNTFRQTEGWYKWSVKKTVR